ncbi:proline/glycine betaine ABC transporter substrate-binding protein ProX [Corticibacter populi]|uniref:Proline/glycine betaine ABC transporter substrate-binding protein ProX n=1 Tax=Corticibacter populi TaxID=1550736 RepID=A0A3M6R1K2_9BURK|nr:glycine betaine/L-proline ABC transporter substrate-binding protein ProX [Corticibacter populi]RMX08632.1 proline/glycine betaine ABC transporter substrate-binding protein ProX [Corticibacter populi]RZS35964.1 glycine betaine/proline transport system substrate-binding protein [Corticibacter populi]
MPLKTLRLRSAATLATFVTLAVTCALSLGAAPAAAQDALPGKGVAVQPVQTNIAEETFQTLLVLRALEKLGYDVKRIQETDYSAAYLAIGNGDATFIATNWQPLHDDFYKQSGGDTRFYRPGTYVTNLLQGYLIDKKTADAHGITSVEQLKDPAIAKLFDTNGDGKADLTGCNPGWGCEAVIEHHLDAYGLRGTVTHNQGNYSALIADTIARYRAGQPIFYYAWTPYWVSGVLKPDQDVVWLQVPFSSLPGEQKGIDTQLPDGSNYGFPVNTMHIAANRAFAEQNPAAAKLFEIMRLPIGDISAQNLRMQEGENRQADIERHVDAWIKANQATFDGWLEQALAAAR